MKSANIRGIIDMISPKRKAPSRIKRERYIELLNTIEQMRSQEVIERSSINIFQYHGTCDIFDNFKPFCHFGTEDAAVTAWRSKAHQRHGIQFDEGQENNAAIILGNRKIPTNLSLGIIHKVALFLTNPLYVNDFKERHNIGHIAKALQSVPGISKSQFKQLDEENTRVLMVNILNVALDLGYDGLAYVNGTEDVGSTSYTNFFAKQAKIVESRAVYVRNVDGCWRHNPWRFSDVE